MNIDLLEELLAIAMTNSVIVVAFIQKIKMYFKTSKFLPIVSFVVNMILGVLFCLTFTDTTFPTSLWVGLFSFIGADTLYKALEGKLKKHDEIVKEDVKVIERGDK